MSVSSIGGSVPQYQMPTTPQAKANDERSESQTVRNQEAESGRESAVAVKSQSAGTQHVDVKA